MKKTKSTILLIKLAVLCALTFGLIYTQPIEGSVAAGNSCTMCFSNCDLMHKKCLGRWYCDSKIEREAPYSYCNDTCRGERTECRTQCTIIVCDKGAAEMMDIPVD